MQIAEMRTALDTQNQKEGRGKFPPLPESFPDWAVRHMYERRNGLELTPLPPEVIQRAANLRTERAKAAIADSGTARTIDTNEEADRERARVRLAVARLQ